MICAWNELLGILPTEMREVVDKQGRDRLQELRLRLGCPPELFLGQGSLWLDKPVTQQQISFVINMASRYSPWSAETVSQGYLTAAGGHRIGICGEAAVTGSELTGIRNPTGLCIRVARDFGGIGAGADKVRGNLLILGPPGSGKTTLLRDLIRRRSESGPGSVAVIDERGELFPLSNRGYCFPTGKRTDIMTGCTKHWGIETAVRTMGPQWIAVDEITAQADCEALIRALWCGVSVMATAHATEKQDLYKRAVYRPLIQCGAFENVLVLGSDKSWRTERLDSL